MEFRRVLFRSGVRGVFNGEPGVGMAVIQQPGANALDAAQLVLDEIEAASADFPPGLEYQIPFNLTEYVQTSVTAVQETLVEALILVLLNRKTVVQGKRVSVRVTLGGGRL